MSQQLEHFDLVIIGGGPAGYTGAIRAAQLGMKVACIEKRSTLGGTCLNEGCIPSKALLNYSEKFEESSKHFAEIGIEAAPKLNLRVMLEKKNQVVRELCKGIEGLFNKNKIRKFSGTGSITEPSKIQITLSDGGIEEINAKNILIATGSEIIQIPDVKIDERNILSSTGALDIPSVPKSLIVIGGGYIGLELGSVWRRLGAEVTVIEYLDRIVPAVDDEIAQHLTKILTSQGMKLQLGMKVQGSKVEENKVTLKVTKSDGSNPSEIVAEKILVAVGRRPYTSGLGLEELDIKVDERGRIPVNAHFQTVVTNIYAVGDVIVGPMLAHKAEEEAIAAVEIMAGQAGHVNYKTIPSVIYTWPEVASVGATESELKKAGIDYKVGKFPFLANSRARSTDNTAGFVKILAKADNDEIIGAHIIGPDAGTMISEITLGMEFKAAAEDIARTCHPHPTLNEAIKEAALAVSKRAINF